MPVCIIYSESLFICPLLGVQSKKVFLAGGKGFEPLLTDSESAVLPLDEPPIARAKYSTTIPWFNAIFQATFSSMKLNALRRRCNTTALPRICMDSNKGGLMRCPLITSRRKPKNWRGSFPSCSISARMLVSR